ncbi:hypothetical protein DL96DRAFT_1780289 [Flagelloscypha sp. PMI_526]|nr:hypothetical protein DL96DRAFT_1780289 [Flagelloscypha sp. PMI_526]
MHLVEVALIALSAFLQCSVSAHYVSLTTASRGISIRPEAREASTSAVQRRDEQLVCYNEGTTIDRERLLSALNNFCDTSQGVVWNTGQASGRSCDGGDGKFIWIWAENINGCGPWAVDSNCYHILHRIMDDCDTDTTSEKQGGELWDPCGHWRMDPGTGESFW